MPVEVSESGPVRGARSGLDTVYGWCFLRPGLGLGWGGLGRGVEGGGRRRMGDGGWWCCPLSGAIDASVLRPCLGLVGSECVRVDGGFWSVALVEGLVFSRLECVRVDEHFSSVALIEKLVFSSSVLR